MHFLQRWGRFGFTNSRNVLLFTAPPHQQTVNRPASHYVIIGSNLETITHENTHLQTTTLIFLPILHEISSNEAVKIYNLNNYHRRRQRFTCAPWGGRLPCSVSCLGCTLELFKPSSISLLQQKFFRFLVSSSIRFRCVVRPVTVKEQLSCNGSHPPLCFLSDPCPAST